MKKKFVNSTMDFITKNKNCSDLEIITIRYGLEGLYNNITKIVVVIILAIIFKSLLEFTLIFISYIFIRRFSFGLHASSSIGCWFTTVPVYFGGSLLIKIININPLLSYFLWLLAFISFILWAPADTPKRPLIREKQRKVQKIKTCLISLIYLLIIILFPYKLIINAIIYSLLIQAIMVNPLSYLITNTEFNSYKKYPNKV